MFTGDGPSFKEPGFKAVNTRLFFATRKMKKGSEKGEFDIHPEVSAQTYNLSFLNVRPSSFIAIPTILSQRQIVSRLQGLARLI